MTGQIPFRDTFWNVPAWAQIALYAGALAAVAVFVYGMWQRVRLWRAGRPQDRFDRVPERVKLVLVHALGQARTLSQAYPGVMHAIIFWGFLALFMGTVLATIDWDITLPLFDVKLLQGPFYLFYETVLDLFGLFFVIGLGMAVGRRFVARPDRLDPTARFAGVLALLFVINLTGFIMEACRLAVVEPAWAPWSPVGWALGRTMLAAGMSEGALRALHLGTWLFHAAISLAFVAVIPYSYFVHLLTTPLNIFFSKLGPRGEIPKIENIEEAESFGISKLEEFSWKRRLDFDACVECGRCQAVCPAYMAGTALSPKQIIVKLKRHLHGELPGPIHGQLIKAEELWACTTCMACVQECPAFIDIVDTIIDLRRYLALSEGALPSTAPQSLQNIQRAGNPWGLPASERLAWAHGLDVPLMEPGKEVEYLYWVGCSASYDKRNQSIARSVVRILKAAGVSFAVMPEERCHGEVARRLGEEYLYQTVQQENVEALGRYRFRKVLTHCPHCFNTIKNEFPQFGGTYEVVHHSVVINELLAAGRIKPKKALDATLAFHDSCYLGRYNGIMEAPRAVARALPGLRVIEMPRNRERGLCCGGGGGHMWMEVKSRKRVNIIRVEEALETEATMVGTACPFCLAMIDLGRKVKGAEERLQVKDVSELVAESLE
ncbi:MAG TPA: heterodisulfide reductase-related iron-sulfur binding cluster [Methylomirabilota bacterium]|jgi:Fe-S oxidoreductase|nr:heterodisulfide reductase-related iron-sulfur binding cluster [Methylomirabilota bacterium]